MYKVRTYTSIEHDFMLVLEQLQRERVEFPRTIIYCRRMKDCSDLYLFFSACIIEREFIIEPPGAPPLSRFRLVEMFMSCTDHDIKNQIISSFTEPSPLQIVCATIVYKS